MISSRPFAITAGLGASAALLLGVNLSWSPTAAEACSQTHTIKREPKGEGDKAMPVNKAGTKRPKQDKRFNTK